MKKKILAICDSESLYAYQLAEYFNQKKGLAYEIHAFSGWSSLAEFLEQQRVEVLLIEEAEVVTTLSSHQIPTVMILSSKKMTVRIQEYLMIYKYQSAAGIIQAVMEVIGEGEETLYPAAIGEKQKVEIIGVYSPLSYVGKTSFSLTLGKVFSEERSTLYINLEPYSGWEGIWEKKFKQDLTDLICAVRQKSGNSIAKLRQAAARIGKLDYIPPAAVSLDLNEVETSEWKQLITEISTSGLYEVIILDIGIQISPELLQLCQIIYTPVREGVLDQMKLEQYKESIKRMGFEELLKRTKFLKLPLQGLNSKEQNLDSLVWGELGQFIKKEILDGQTGGSDGSEGDTESSSGTDQYIARDF